MFANWKTAHTLQVILGVMIGVCGVVGSNFPQYASYATPIAGALTGLLTALGVLSPSSAGLGPSSAGVVK